ncbi:TWiK family of potassium channels protein 7 [Trichuris trichiura]|uniref:TWiK family of potassium channels protein 7 n=1 Tax=Trichuris trichiura TaxID=36087 RepID=A0A077ZAN8_TRITR|nr:TWiK family of potassium channels protein 7 [Trichuris trichiura]
MKLEEPHVRQLHNQVGIQVQADKDQFLARLLELSRSSRSKEEGEIEFRNYVRNLYGTFETKGLRERENLRPASVPLDGGYTEKDRLSDATEEWSFAAALFFVLTTLTTIGYGDMVPMTREGRVFCLCYCIIGIPLVLVTTANVAKFMSAGVYFLYVKYLLLREKMFRALNHLKQRYIRMNVEAPKVSIEADQMLLQSLETLEYVRLSAPVILLIIVGYAALVSILTVGFGDFVPSEKRFIIISMIYVFVGLLIATMCIDTVGVHLAGARDKVMHTLVTKQNECLLENLCSFTAYSIKLTVSLGKRKCPPINLLVVTEPETSPQNITIKPIDSKSVFLRWSSPCKSKNIVKAYAIYYSNHLPNAFENWQKKIVPAEERSSLVTDLENPEDYYFCMSSVYETYHSPLSKPICISENPSVKPGKYLDIALTSVCIIVYEKPAPSSSPCDHTLKTRLGLSRKLQ